MLTLRPRAGVTRLQLAGFYALVSLTISVFVFVNAAQPALLRQVLALSRPSAGEDQLAPVQHSEPPRGIGSNQTTGPRRAALTGELGDASGTILVMAEITALIIGLASGVISDGIGRRVVYSSGLAICAIAVASSPSASTFQQVLGLRCMFSVGTGCTATMITAVLADFVHPEDNGRGAGMVGMAAGVGAVFGALVLMRVASVAQWMSAGRLSPFAAVAAGYHVAAAWSLVGRHSLFPSPCPLSLSLFHPPSLHTRGIAILL
jgi:MFS family permease